MRVLIVEADPTQLDVLIESLTGIPGIKTEYAKSRDSACERLEATEYDLIICDLKIPTRDNELDLSTEHGDAVIACSNRRYPGTPVIILSAFGTLERARDAVRNAARQDVVGDGQDCVLVDYRTKDELAECIEYVRALASRLGTTDAIDLQLDGPHFELYAGASRAIRIFARSLGGEVVHVSALTGGFSGTLTLRIRVESFSGQLKGIAVAKIGKLATVAVEAKQYARLVAPLLPVGSYTTLQYHVKAGAGDTGALFYQLASDATSLFAAVSGRPTASGDLVDKLAERLAKWHEGAAEEVVTVSHLREAAGIDTPHLKGIDVDTFERRDVTVRTATQHCDLHADNVLVSASDEPVMIDYAEVAESRAGYDAVVLELSLLFHPEGVKVRGTWPTLDQIKNWDDLERYVQDCPAPEFVRACRRWALSVCSSQKEAAAFAYLYAIRQLKYADTNKDYIQALASCAARVLG